MMNEYRGKIKKMINFKQIKKKKNLMYKCKGQGREGQKNGPAHRGHVVFS